MAIGNQQTTRLRHGASTTAVAEMDLVRWSGAPRVCAPMSDLLAREEPLEIRVGGRSVAVTMRTPGHDAELTVGFLVTEGLIQERSDLLGVVPCRHRDASSPGNRMNVLLAPHVALDFSQLTRHVFASSSCGLCGKSSIEAIQQTFPPIATQFVVSAKVVAALPDRMRAAQHAFEMTGGLHAAALFDFRGRLVTLHEDVGRHNAVDKAIGHAFLQRRFPLDRQLLLVSGRASFEIVQKALAARIGLVCAVSAPSTLAVEFARANEQTLVGFLRGQGFNVYAREDRILRGAFEGAPDSKTAHATVAAIPSARRRSGDQAVKQARVSLVNRNRNGEKVRA